LRVARRRASRVTAHHRASPRIVARYRASLRVARRRALAGIKITVNAYLDFQI